MYVCSKNIKKKAGVSHVCGVRRTARLQGTRNKGTSSSFKFNLENIVKKKKKLLIMCMYSSSSVYKIKKSL
jgi:hypothetical protein